MPRSYEGDSGLKIDWESAAYVMIVMVIMIVITIVIILTIIIII